MLYLPPWEEVQQKLSHEETEAKGLDIPLPQGLCCTAVNSIDSEPSDESSLRSSTSSSLNNSTSSNANPGESSSLKSSTSSGVYSKVSETSNSDSNSNSRSVNTTAAPSSSLQVSDTTNAAGLLRLRNSTGSINVNSGKTFSAQEVGRSLNQVGDKYEQTHILRFPIDLVNPLTARSNVGVTIGHIFNTMIKPLSADSDRNRDSFPVHPLANKTPSTLSANSSIDAARRSSNSVSPDVQLAQYYRVQELVVCDEVLATCTGDELLSHNLLEQPSTVFVYCPDLACVVNRMSNKKLSTHACVVRDKYVVVTASIHKHYSMKEKAETSPAKAGTSNDNTPSEEFRDTGKFDTDMTVGITHV